MRQQQEADKEPKGKGKGKSKPYQDLPKEECSVHKKIRSGQNLVDDGMGGKRCAVWAQCNTGGDDEPAQLPPWKAAKEWVKEGDWICEKCNDHQFARNTECRQCKAPKP